MKTVSLPFNSKWNYHDPDPSSFVFCDADIFSASGSATNLLQPNQPGLWLYAYPKFQRMGSTPSHSRSGNCEFQRKLYPVQHQSMGLLDEPGYVQLDFSLPSFSQSLEQSLRRTLRSGCRSCGRYIDRDGFHLREGLYDLDEYGSIGKRMETAC